MIIILNSGGRRDHRNGKRLFFLIFRIIKYAIIFIIILFLYQRLPDFIAGITYSLKKFFSF
ncbi:hypothetical protein [Treponema pedis]|uniref:hypothetical protein n=1 Tax=Treponema pedis TaxID=409322 RepID=UPI00041732C1|nr:hypothetical protein [Treponema pedis]